MSQERLIHLSVKGNSDLPTRCQICPMPEDNKCPTQPNYGDNPPGYRTCVKRQARNDKTEGFEPSGIGVQRFQEATSLNHNGHHEVIKGAGTPEKAVNGDGANGYYKQSLEEITSILAEAFNGQSGHATQEKETYEPDHGIGNKSNGCIIFKGGLEVGYMHPDGWKDYY